MVPAKILIADNEAGQSLLKEALEGYDLVLADTFQHANTRLLEDGIDLAICGITFDDSRMVELIREARKDPRHAMTPFIVFRSDSLAHEKMLRDAIEGMRIPFGLSAYIELDLKSTDSINLLRSEIEKFLPIEKVISK